MAQIADDDQIPFPSLVLWCQVFDPAPTETVTKCYESVGEAQREFGHLRRQFHLAYQYGLLPTAPTSDN